MSVDTKQGKRIVDPQAGLEKIRRERECRACGATDRLGRHHLVPRARGEGDDVELNLIPLCDSCHTAVHGGTNSLVVRYRIRHSLRPEERVYVIAQKNLEWLNRAYPWEETDGR